MSVKDICHKSTGIYRTSDDIKNFAIRVKLKKINSFIELPKINNIHSQNDIEIKDTMGEKVIKWQEKVICKNVQETGSESEIFTYINEDNFEDYLNTNEDYKTKQNHLQKNMEKLKNKLEETIQPSDSSVVNYSPDTNTMESHYVNNYCKTMCIMADLKPDYCLSVLKWFPADNVLTVFPDFNDVTYNPYIVVVDVDNRNLYHYSIENVSMDLSNEDRITEIELNNKLSKLKLQATSQGEFETISNRLLRVVVLIEIVSAKDFENDRVYVDYFLDLPVGWTCMSNDPGVLEGTTQTSNKGLNGVSGLGHCWEVDLICDLNIVGDSKIGVGTSSPRMFFEVISRDWWNRHRTEGYTFTNLSVTEPRVSLCNLSCSRPDSRGVSMRRYFVGGSHMLDDVTWLAGPKTGGNQVTKNVKYGIRTKTTGVLTVKTSVLTQANVKNQALLKSISALKKRVEASNHGDCISNRTNRSSSNGRRTITGTVALVRSVEGVMEAYREARVRLMAARGLQRMGDCNNTIE